MGTDKDWEKWGAIDPYFGVYSDEKFRTRTLTQEARAEFFRSGQAHVDQILKTIRTSFDPSFAPRSAMDFGSGVGRLVIPMAGRMARVVGVDISPSMIAEARKNCAAEGIANVHFAISNDTLSNVDEVFDLVHSDIVLQHIPWRRGRRILQSLSGRVGAGGYLAAQILTACGDPLLLRSLVRLRYSFPPFNWARNLLRARPLLEPAMQLHVYDLPVVLNDLAQKGFDAPHCVEDTWSNYTSVTIYARRKSDSANA